MEHYNTHSEHHHHRRVALDFVLDLPCTTLSDFALLHRACAATRFSILSDPPAWTGTTWSAVNAIGLDGGAS